LPACNAGVSAVSVGDEVIGTAAALLGAGVGSVIAPLTTVNDEATVRVMKQLHRELAGGWTPPAALSRTRAALSDAPSNVRAAAASFVCLA
jgi:CHAT domain-containing protein